MQSMVGAGSPLLNRVQTYLIPVSSDECLSLAVPLSLPVATIDNAHNTPLLTVTPKIVTPETVITLPSMHSHWPKLELAFDNNGSLVGFNVGFYRFLILNWRNEETPLQARTFHHQLSHSNDDHNYIVSLKIFSNFFSDLSSELLSFSLKTLKAERAIS